jgi:hypothetical protein
MGLADVSISVTDFQLIVAHLATYRTPSGALHRNMHMRQPKPKIRPATLRYLHAMCASRTNEIDGAISGPDVFWLYRIRMTNGRTQVDVLDRKCSAKEDTEIQGRFLKEVMGRVRQEQTGASHPYSNLIDGEFYLRRCMGGISPDHSRCARAVSEGTLHPRFVAQLEGWNLTLLCP